MTSTVGRRRAGRQPRTYRRRRRHAPMGHADGVAVLSGKVPARLALYSRRVAVEQGANLGLAVTAVAAQRADRGELAGLGPARHGLRVDAEQRRNLRRGEQSLGFGTMADRRHGAALLWNVTG